MLRRFPLVCIAVVLGWNLFAQTSKSVTIHRLDPGQKINLDGLVNDSLWKHVTPIADFVMQEPIEGGVPTERTEVRLAYDAENLYIAVTLYDSDPSGIKAFTKGRDGDIDNEDSFTWYFDTYLDQRNAYVFEINPLGLKTDGLLSTGQGSTLNRDWDGIWELKTHIGQFGWSAEIRLPFRTFNFDENSDVWGINFRRVIRRKNEVVLWTGYQLHQGIYRPQDGGTLTGLEGISQGIGLEAKPYASIKNEQTESDKSKTFLDAGFDVNYNITSNLKASVTINTDFAETEVDDRQVNLTRFPLRFPEKRDFFLEGAGIYSYAPSSFVEPYFSRRIGLRNGRPIPISYGGRILGRVGNLDVAILHVRTGEKDTLAPEDFTVARLKQNIGTESTIGFVYTRRSTKNGEDLPMPLQDRHSFGADVELNTSSFLKDKNLQFQAFFTFHNPPSPLDDMTDFWDRSSRGVRLNFPNRPWFGHCSYREFGNAFDPAVGFNDRNGFRRVDPRVGYARIFEKSDVLREATWTFRYENLWDLDFDLLTQNMILGLVDLRFESGEEMTFQMVRNYERLEFDFDILRNGTIIIPLDEYRNWRAEAEVRTARYRKVAANIEFSRGGFWSGTRTVWEFDVVFRPLPGLNLNIEYTNTDVSLEQGDFETNLLELSGSYDISPELSLSSKVQYDDLSKVFGMNHRFRWIIDPGSDIYIVYTQNWLRQSGDYRKLDRSSVIKVNYTHWF